MRAYAWGVPCLFALGALSACSANIDGETAAGSGGGGGTATSTGAGEGGSGTSTGTGGDVLGVCPDQTLRAGACLVPAAGFVVEDPPAPLDLDVVATVTEIGEGAPPYDCEGSQIKVLNGSNKPGQVWARLEDDTMQEWVVAVAVPTLQAGFNGHIVVGDTVNVSLQWSLKTNGVGFGYMVADLGLSRDDVLVAYVSEQKRPPWYTQDQAVCQDNDTCCLATSFNAMAEVGGEVGVVPSGGTAEVGGLAISNLEFVDMADIAGCCNFFEEDSPFSVAAAALPAP